MASVPYGTSAGLLRHDVVTSGPYTGEWKEHPPMKLICALAVRSPALEGFPADLEKAIQKPVRPHGRRRSDCRSLVAPLSKDCDCQEILDAWTEPLGG